MLTRHSRSHLPRNVLFSLVALTALAFQFSTSHSQPQGPRATRAATTPAAALPDSTLTPGATDPRVTQQNIASTICRYGYTRSVRPPFEISNNLKHQVMALYHSPSSIHDYELDHLIPLELGGCPDCIKNLWPQPWTSPGAHEKDQVETLLHDRVCHNQMTLSDAQQVITMNWYSVYLTITPLEQGK